MRKIGHSADTAVEICPDGQPTRNKVLATSATSDQSAEWTQVGVRHVEPNFIRDIIGAISGFFFGRATDGNVDFNTTNGTQAGATRSSSTWTFTRDVRASNVWVRTGVTVDTNGYRLFVTGTLYLEGTAVISNDGEAGQSGGQPTAGIAGAAAGQGTVGGGGDGKAGGTGGSGGDNDTGGANGGAISNSIGGAAGAGGAGGNATFSGSAGGGAGAKTSSASNVFTNFWDAFTLVDNGVGGGTAGQILKGGPGGGSGGGGSYNAGGSVDGGGGGGSGGGGGVVAIYARVIDVTGWTGRISGNGGNGGNGGSVSGTGDGGGGGGGGGGAAFVLALIVTGGSLIEGTNVTANGGPGGTAGDGGTAGSAGSAGTTFVLVATQPQIPAAERIAARLSSVEPHLYEDDDFDPNR